MHRRINIIIFLIAIILAGVAIYFIMSYINEIESAYTSVSTKPVVVAVQNIPENIAITDEMLKVVEVPADMVLPQAYDSIEDIVGSIAKTDIVKDEHILINHIYKEGKGQDKFSYSVPENMRAVSIAINDVSGVSGLIKANDRVDILLTYAYPGDAREEAEAEEAETQGEQPAMAESTEKALIDREYLREISEEILKDRRIHHGRALVNSPPQRRNDLIDNLHDVSVIPEGYTCPGYLAFPFDIDIGRGVYHYLRYVGIL
ncbi:MAG: Flp pilus assembly protein CpaB [Caldicoprobacterales bacterium]|jgi:hypothetical protein